MRRYDHDGPGACGERLITDRGLARVISTVMRYILIRMYSMAISGVSLNAGGLPGLWIAEVAQRT